MRGKFRRMGGRFEYVVGDAVQYVCDRVGVSFNTFNQEILFHGPAEEIRERTIDERERLIRRGMVSEANGLVAITFPESIDEKDLNDFVSDPRKMVKKL